MTQPQGDASQVRNMLGEIAPRLAEITNDVVLGSSGTTPTASRLATAA